MIYDRVRIIFPDGQISVLDKTNSQMVQLLKGLSKPERDAFWRKQETRLPTGESVVLVKEGV